MSRPYVNLNGRLLPASEARVGVLDHGMLYGDGLFETLRVCGGRVFRVREHLARLLDGCRRLDLSLGTGAEELETALESVVAANGMREGALRLTVTRGEGPPVPDPGVCPQPNYFITARDWKPDTLGNTVWTVAVTGTHPRTFIPGIKSLCYLPFQQARSEARRRGFDEAILTHAGAVVEASTSNLFVIAGGRLWTPDLQSGCLPGIARGIVIELATDRGLEVVEAALPLERLWDADEVLASNSLLGPVPVVRVDDRTVGCGQPGPVSTRLVELYSELVRRVCNP